jgi:tellurite resistance protein
MTNLEKIACEVQAHGYCMHEWGELAESTSIDGFSSQGLEQLYYSLCRNDIDMLPKIVKSSKGYSVASVSKSITERTLVFFHPHKPLDRQNDLVKKALFTARVATTMAKIDGFIAQEEIRSLRTMIYSLPYLSESDKYAVFIRGLYFLQQGFRQDDLLASFESYEHKTKMQVIEVAKSIIISDGKIDRSEKFFLKHLYKATGLSTCNLVRELKEYAEVNGISMKSRSNTASSTDVLTIEGNLILEGLLDEFMEF